MKAGGGKKQEPVEDPLFRATVADVTPLARRNRVARGSTLPAPERRRASPAAHRAADALSDHVPWNPDASASSGFLRAGMQRQTLRQLRRGHWRVAAELDLHGYTADEARVSLASFLDACARRGARCVRIVHGRGMRSAGAGPVLKRKVAAWLVQREDVLAYCEARPVDGGAGAVMVLLRRADNDR